MGFNELWPIRQPKRHTIKSAVVAWAPGNNYAVIIRSIAVSASKSPVIELQTYGKVLEKRNYQFSGHCSNLL